MTLDNKVAIITGAAMGMGAVHAEEFIKQGAKVALTDIAVDEGQKLADKLGDNAIFIKLDVSSTDDWKQAVSQVLDKWNRIDILVNNAGFAGPFATIDKLDPEDYLKVISIDQHGTFYGMQAVIPTMIEQGGGSIINISSIAGVRHPKSTQNVAYTASKYAVRGLTKAAAIELAEHNIRVNAVLPGGVLTPMMAEALSQDDIDTMNAGVPLGRLGDSKEITAAIMFFASDAGSYATGADLIIDGGWTAQ